MYGTYGMYVPSTLAYDARLDAPFNCQTAWRITTMS